MAEKKLNAHTPIAEAPIPSMRLDASSITTFPIFEEHPTPVAIGAEAPPFASTELSTAGPFGTY